MFDQDSPTGAGGGAPASRQVHRARPDDGPEILAQRQPSGGGRRQSGGARQGGAVHNSQRTAAKKRRRRRTRRIVVISICLVVLLLAGAVVWGYNYIAGQLRGADTVDGVVPDEVKTDTIPEYTGKGIITALICGIDYDNDTADGYTDDTNKIGNTDLIMYLMYDTVNNKANILQIPRDTFVGEDDYNTNGIGKINALYRYSDDPDNRVAPLARCLKDQYQLPVDFYITIDMDAVKAIVDHMQFIQVYVPHEVTDGETGEQLLPEGWVNITSREIEFLVRNRNYGDGDINRMRTQQSLYSALFREFKKLAPGDLVMWMRILLHYCNIDGISVMQIGGLAQSALALEGEDLTFVRPPYTGAWYTPTSGPLEGKRQSLVCLEPEGTAEILNTYFRPDGHTIPAEELNIHTLPVNEFGEGPAEVKTMTGIQEVETEIPPPW